MLTDTSKPGYPRGLRCSLAAVLAAVALLLAGPAAYADPVQFASFQNTTGNPFTFSNYTTTATLSASSQITFNFTANTGLDTGDRAATLTMAGFTTAPATSMNIGGSTWIDQPINAPSTLIITENSTGRLLLGMSFTGNLFGQNNSPNASLAGYADSGDTVLFSSYYLNPISVPGASYNLNMPTSTPLLSLGLGNFLNSFVSNINGSFVGNITAVPQPMSVVMFGTGMTATMVLAHRARRKRLRTVVNACIQRCPP